MLYRWKMRAMVATIVMGLTFDAPIATAHDVNDTAEPVLAIWHQHRIAFEYHSFNTRYSCGSLQSKLRLILKAVGARDDIQVESSCMPDDLVSSVTMLVTLQVPVVASEANVRVATAYTTEQQLVARLRGMELPTANDLPRFDAEWRSVSLIRNGSLRLNSGDCELLMRVHADLLPKLGVATQVFDCYNSARHHRPKVQVAALIPVESSAAP